MKSRAIMRSVWGVFLGAGLCLLSQGVVAESKSVAGQFSVTYAKQEALPISDAEGHMLILGEAHGRNVGKNGSDYMDGGTVINKEIADLFQGNGPHSGYVTMSKDGSDSVSKWQGEVTTTLNQDGTPNTTFKGSWEAASGTGKYQGVKGNGTYQGYFTSQTDYVVDWNGRLDY
ncbi:MAG: hypothetical protein HYY48_03500 [Gammaproteobacteria bacterium]|nr:hypothetical protein [Gammaproteobacteria bacterium]